MNRQEILNEIVSATGSNRGLYEYYSTSELKQILDDMKTVTFSVDDSVYKTIVVVMVLGLCGIYLIR